MNQGYNRVTLFGNLGADPELRKLANGRDMLRMNLATNQSWMNREGVREERTDWHRVLVWGNRAEGLSRILRKGSFVLIEGQIRTHSYEKDGEKRYSTEIHADEIILGGRSRGPAGPGSDVDSYQGAFHEMEAPEEMEARPPVGPGEERDGEEPEPETYEVPRPTPKPRRGGEGGGAEVVAPPPPRRRRAPATTPVMAQAA